MKNNFPGGVWPVMLTPFLENGEVDYAALGGLVHWYIENGVSGLFAVCQSSEMFSLTLEERAAISRTVVRAACGRVPVIASGHTLENLEGQLLEITTIAETGVDAVILITNRLAKQNEDEGIWIENCKKLLNALPKEIALGFYECPFPYKRKLPTETIKWCADTERFFFLKDTCCDAAEIREKLEAAKGSGLKLYNANTSTLLESLRDGAAGYSGVMANFHPGLYSWLCGHYKEKEADDLSDQLTLMSLIERQCYPVNAKYHLKTVEGLGINTLCRVKDERELTETYKKEVLAMERIVRKLAENRFEP